MGLFRKNETRAMEAEILTSYYQNNTITVKQAVEIPSVERCVNMISGAIGSLPVKLYRKTADGVEEITGDKRVKMLNSTTGDTLNADEMRRMWVSDYLLYGNAYAVIENEKGVPSRLYYIPPMNVGVQKDNLDIVHKSYSYYIQGKRHDPKKMLKMLRNSDGFGEGKGIVEENQLILDTMIQLLKFQRNQVVKGGNKRGFLKSPNPIRPETAAEMKSKWKRFNSNESSETFILLNGDVDFKEMSSTSVEMQMNESYTTNSGEIMKLFGTTDGVLSDETVKNAVMPVIDAFEAAFDSDLLTEAERMSGMYFAFDTKELTRGDMSSRFNAYATALSNSFMQLDEVRELEDLPPMDFNYIKLGLNDVLLDPKTNKIYTPNTNAMVDFGKNGIDNKETRGDYIQLDNGKLNGSLPGGKTEKGIDKFSKKNYNYEKEEDSKYKSQATEYSKKIKGSTAYDSSEVKTFSPHAARRMEERNMTFDEVKDVLRKANITYPSKRHKNARVLKLGDNVVVYNSKTGIVLTVWKITA